MSAPPSPVPRRGGHAAARRLAPQGRPAEMWQRGVQARSAWLRGHVRNHGADRLLAWRASGVRAWGCFDVTWAAAEPGAGPGRCGAACVLANAAWASRSGPLWSLRDGATSQGGPHPPSPRRPCSCPLARPPPRPHPSREAPAACWGPWSRQEQRGGRAQSRLFGIRRELSPVGQKPAPLSQRAEFGDGPTDV